MAEANSETRYLPLELIFEIMSCLLPENPHAIVPRHHPVTQLLIALSTVSRATHKEAIKILKQHCLHINNFDQLCSFVRCLQASNESTLDLPSVFKDITSIHINLQISLDGSLGSIITLFAHIGGSLKRLSIRMDDIYPPHFREQATILLREAFKPLVNLEELICSALFFWMAMWEMSLIGRQGIIFPALKRLGVENLVKAAITWKQNLPKFLRSFPCIERIVLIEMCACTFIWSVRDIPEYIRSRQEQSKGPITIMLGEANNTRCYRESTIRHIERQGGGYLHITKHSIPKEDLGVNFWPRIALAGGIWDLTGYRQTYPPTPTYQTEVAEADAA